jgi:hypothetical protein
MQLPVIIHITRPSEAVANYKDCHLIFFRFDRIRLTIPLKHKLSSKFHINYVHTVAILSKVSSQSFQSTPEGNGDIVDVVRNSQANDHHSQQLSLQLLNHSLIHSVIITFEGDIMHYCRLLFILQHYQSS